MDIVYTCRVVSVNSFVKKREVEAKILSTASPNAAEEGDSLWAVDMKKIPIFPFFAFFPFRALLYRENSIKYNMPLHAMLGILCPIVAKMLHLHLISGDAREKTDGHFSFLLGRNELWL